MDEPKAPMETTNSSDVNRALREMLWPALKDAGFVERTARTAWRRHADRIDVVNFQSFNAYLAQQIGATTFTACR